MHLAQVRTEGGLPKARARAVAEAGLAPILQCYRNKATPRTSGVGGRLTLRLLLRRSGKVGRVKMIRSTLAHAELEYCASKAIQRSWRFGRSRRWVRYVWVTLDFALYRNGQRTGLTRYVERAPRAASGISRKAIVATFARIRRRLRRLCRKRGSASLTLTIRGRTGQITHVRTAATLPRCVTRVLETTRFPRFKADTMQVTLPIVW